MPLPTIYGPDSWGGIRIPVDPQTAIDVTPNDPCLWYIASFLKSFLADDENVKAQWDAQKVAPGIPPVKEFFVANPADEGFTFNHAQLPALYIWRESDATGYLGDSIGKAESVVKMLWVYPQAQSQNKRAQLPFYNALYKGIWTGVERGRTPGWIVGGETDPFALGAPLWTPTTAFTTGFQVVPSTPTGFLFNCTVAGVTGSPEPTWPIVVGNTVTDGTVTWQNAGVWTPNGSLFWKWAAFAQLWVEKARPTTLKIVSEKGKQVVKYPAIEIACSMLEDFQFGTTNRALLDKNTGLEVSTSPSQTSAVWAPATFYDLNVGPMHPTVPNNFSYVCSVAGTSGLTEPTWPLTQNTTVVDGTCTWKCVGPVTNTDDVIA